MFQKFCYKEKELRTCQTTCCNMLTHHVKVCQKVSKFAKKCQNAQKVAKTEVLGYAVLVPIDTPFLTPKTPFLTPKTPKKGVKNPHFGQKGGQKPQK